MSHHENTSQQKQFLHYSRWRRRGEKKGKGLERKGKKANKIENTANNNSNSEVREKKNPQSKGAGPKYFFVTISHLFSLLSSPA
jgi:hypothetical protein